MGLNIIDEIIPVRSPDVTSLDVIIDIEILDIFYKFKPKY
jgi:hypothetical protein